MASTLYRIGLQSGQLVKLMDIDETGAGTYSQTYDIGTEAMLASLYVESTSGDIDVSITTHGPDGSKSTSAINFPTVSAPSTELLIKKAAIVLSKITVTVTFTAGCKFSLHGKGIQSGDASVSINKAASASASQNTMTTTAAAIISASINDRFGFVIRNFEAAGSGQILYVGFSLAEATVANGYPIPPGESMAMDLDSAVTVYGIVETGTVDVRILQGGG